MILSQFWKLVRICREMSQRFFPAGTVLLLLVTLGCLAGPSPNPTPTPDPFPYLVILVIDGCRPEYLDLAPLPHLEQLAREGVTFERAWVGQVVSNTPPGHATIATGTLPSRHGLVSFWWKEAETGEVVWPTRHEDVRVGEETAILEAAGVPTFASLYRRRHPAALVAATGGYKSFAVAALGLDADAVLFAYMPSAENVRRDRFSGNEERASPAGWRVVPETVPGQEPPVGSLNDPTLFRAADLGPGDGDVWAMDATLALWEEMRPQVLLVNLPDVDRYGHAYGGPADPERMAQLLVNVDAQIGRLIEAYKAAGLYEQTVFIVTSDHGMIAGDRYLGEGDLPGPLVEESIRAIVGAHVWLRDSTQAGAVAEAIERARVAGLWGAYVKVEAEDGGFRYRPGPGTAAQLSDEEAWAYEALLNTVAGPRGPDLFLLTEENLLVGGKPEILGHHNTLTWGVQHIPLIIAGPGVPQGVVSQAPARLVDIAPTALALLGIEPEGMDGAILTDALLHPDPAWVRREQEQAALWWAVQEVLIAAGAEGSP